MRDPGPFFADFFRWDAARLRQQLHRPRRAETALAAAHTLAHPPLEAVQRARARRCRKSSSAAVVAVFSRSVGGGGAQQQVAVHGGRHQHALAGRPRQLEDGAAHVAARRFVQQAVIPLARRDVQPAGADLVVQHIA